MNTDLRRRLAMEKLTADDYWAMHRSQDGHCAMCGAEESPVGDRGVGYLHVDRDREIGQIRGLVCGPCMASIVSVTKDPTSLRALADYIEASWSRFLDECEDCARDGRFAFCTPFRVEETDGTSATFIYVCEKDHAWRCWWSTYGLPAI